MPSSKRTPDDAPGPKRAGAPTPSVFISYRRSENLRQATFLEESLAALLGPGAVFRDQTAIKPGDKFPTRLDTTIRGVAVVLVLIGPRWVELRDERSNQRRLDLADDFVRREIEIAIDAKRKIVPLLVDGARMPETAMLPRSIAALSDHQAVELPWHDPLRTIAETVLNEAQRLSDEVRVPVGTSSKANAAARAMEASLRNQNLGRVQLDARELSATLDRLTDFKRDHGAFLMPDLIYAIDMIGVRARRGSARYVARSKAIESLDHLIECLRRNQTVLAGLTMSSAWWNDAATTRGVLDHDPKKAGTAGGLVCIVSGWNERRREFEIHSYRPLLGERGVLTLTYRAVEHLLDLSEARLIEAAPMPLPFSQKAQRDLASRLPRKSPAAKRSPQSASRG
jgi:hypothetical protein